jgi:hypothetical protein
VLLSETDHQQATDVPVNDLIVSRDIDDLHALSPRSLWPRSAGPTQRGAKVELTLEPTLSDAPPVPHLVHLSATLPNGGGRQYPGGHGMRLHGRRASGSGQRIPGPEELGIHKQVVFGGGDLLVDL